MSSQLSAHAITAHTAMTRISVSRCSTLPAHRGSARAEKCSTSFATDIATLPSPIKGEPAQPVSPSEPARPFHASPLGQHRTAPAGFEESDRQAARPGPAVALVDVAEHLHGAQRAGRGRERTKAEGS